MRGTTIVGKVRGLIDQEIAAGMRALHIPSRAALRREDKRLPAGCNEALHSNYYGWADRSLRAVLVRFRAIQLLNDIGIDGMDALEATDECLAELHRILPKAQASPPTKEQMKRLLDCARRFQAEWEADIKKMVEEGRSRAADAA